MPPGNIAVRVGDPYDGPQIVQALERYAASLRGMGFYEARAVHTVTFDANGTATVRVTVDRVRLSLSNLPAIRSRKRTASGSCRFAPKGRQMRTSWRTRLSRSRTTCGHEATATRWRSIPALSATACSRSPFTVDRGVRFVVESVAITGNSVVPAADLEKLVQIQSGQPLVQTAVNRAAIAVRDLLPVARFHARGRPEQRLGGAA